MLLICKIATLLVAVVFDWFKIIYNWIAEKAIDWSSREKVNTIAEILYSKTPTIHKNYKVVSLIQDNASNVRKTRKTSYL